MSATTGTITINHCIVELERTISSRKIHYLALVDKKKMTPYTKESRIAVMETLLSICKKAAEDVNTSVLSEVKKLQ